MPTLVVKVNTKVLDEIIRKTGGLFDAFIADEIGRALVDAAQERVPIRTGDLHDSIEFGHGVVGGKGSFVVSASMHYAGYVEYGTRFMGAQPYLTPAIEDVDYRAISRRALRMVGLR